jgi:tetratricopeptide (TPR) repeat protein
MLKRLQKTGADNAKQLYKVYQRGNSPYYLDEHEVNDTGYFLLYSLSEKNAALELFTINTLEFPHSANAFDSLGEACFANGDYISALTNYKKSLALNPNNENARKMILKLSEAGK